VQPHFDRYHTSSFFFHFKPWLRCCEIFTEYAYSQWAHVELSESFDICNRVMLGGVCFDELLNALSYAGVCCH